MKLQNATRAFLYLARAGVAIDWRRSMIASSDPLVTAAMVTVLLAVLIIALVLVARRIVRTWDRKTEE